MPNKKVAVRKSRKKFPPQAIRKELERILSSPRFTNAPQLSSFLRFVVEESLSGRQQNINQYSIGTRVLGRSTDFDPAMNPIVRIHAGRLRSALKQYYQQKGHQNPIRIVIPINSYAPAFHPCERFSIRQDTNIQALSSINSINTNKPIQGLKEVPSILLLPLTMMKDDPMQFYFAKRLMMKLMVALTRFCHFRIIGPISCEDLKKNSNDPREVGREYDANFLLYGYLYIQENMIKLILKVIEATTGHTLWADTFNNPINIDEIHIFENEISTKVSSILADEHGIISRVLSRKALCKPSESVNVNDAVFLHFYYRDVMSEEAYQSTKEILEHVVNVNPHNHHALVMLADLYTIKYDIFNGSETILKQAKELFNRAISINPKCQHAHFLKARFYLYNEGPRGRKLFMGEIEKTLSLNPNNASILVLSGLFMIIVGERDQGMTLVMKGMRLNPYIPSIYHHMAMFIYYYFQGLYEEAFHEALGINKPEIIWDPLMRAASLGQLDLKKRAEAAISELLALIPDFTKRGGEIIRRVLFSDKNVEMFLKGLYKAGLPH